MCREYQLNFKNILKDNNKIIGTHNFCVRCIKYKDTYYL